jgi:MFS superfamily sulfate permease-like transporter
VSFVLGIPVINAFLITGLVERLPTALLAASLMIIGISLLGLAISLDSLGRFRAEMRRLSYLSHASVACKISSK